MLMSAENEVDYMPSEVRQHPAVNEILQTLYELKEHKEALLKEKKERDNEIEREKKREQEIYNTNHNEFGSADRLFG